MKHTFGNVNKSSCSADVEAFIEKNIYTSLPLLAPLHTNSIAHSPYIVGNDFVVLSYYDDGLQIFKIDDPNNPVQVGYWDTDPDGQTYQGDGAWGAYPYLPSGNLIASDIQNGLFVVRPSFPLRECQSDVRLKGDYSENWHVSSRDDLTVSARFSGNASIILEAPDILLIERDFEVTPGTTVEIFQRDGCDQ